MHLLNAQNSKELADALSILELLYPCNSFYHIGVGATPNREIYDLLHPKECLQVEAQSESAQFLKSNPIKDGVHVREAILSGNVGAATFHHLTLSSESGLLTDADLKVLWRNISVTDKESVNTATLSDLVETDKQLESMKKSAGWLVIECFPSIEILKGAKELLETSIDVVVTRSVVSEKADGELKKSELTAIDKLLTSQGFQRLFTSSERHPEIVVAVFSRRPNRGEAAVASQRDVRSDIEAALEKAVSEAGRARAERDMIRADVEQLRQQHRAITRERDELAKLLGKVKDGLSTVLASETKQSGASSSARSSRTRTKKSDD